MVDEAANLREFAIIKRMEEEMGENIGADLSQILQQNGDESGLVSDFASVAAFVEKAKKMEEMDEEMKKAVAPDLKAAIARVMAFLGKVSGGPSPVMAKKAKVEEEEEKAKKAKVEEEEEKAKKAKVEEEKAEVKKSAAPMDAPAIQVYPDGSVMVQGQPVHKAKGFTTGRTKAMTEVLRGLAGVLKEVDEESFKAVMEEVSGSPSNKLPADAKFASGVQAVPTSKAKEPDSSLDMLKEITTRLEAIEKSRAPSTSVEGDGGNQEPVQKSKSFWAGIL